MSEETNEPREYSEKKPTPRYETTFKDFTFATPNFVTSPEKVINFGATSGHVFSKCQDPDDTFTFAAPAIISQQQQQQQQEEENEDNLASEDYAGKSYKPRIARKVYKPPVNLFTSALRESKGKEKLIQDFDQLKKHSKSRSTAAKVDARNSITCTNVPSKLLTKTAAREYFSAFGNISKMTLRPRKATITVFYINKDAANAAYHKAGHFMGHKFDLHRTSSDLPPKSPAKKKEPSKDAVRNFITADDDEVNAELEAMMGLEYNVHGDGDGDGDGDVPLSKVTESKSKSKPRKPKEIQKPEKPLSRLLPRTEKAETESHAQTIVPKASAEELQNIIRQAAHTSEEKYKILEARDRFLRLKQIKPNTLAAAKITVGTCPDMCPEKERLMRESQRQVALYEQLEGKEYRINHAVAIKQYSRSSADQEEPLAHELRPVESLKMTMSYLLHEIMDMCMTEGTNLAEWFHFLWDRTRGIRKDITQQELCCVESVELVEQCARFHILCSERLCAEEPSVFDKKINTENLTKCLQTLKYMYHDLRVKGVACKNEAEFRGYIILLNLNDGNFMWDLQKLPADIQKSSEVKFAIEVFSSIESHNFSKFFKLVRSTTYLNACILLRYFNQVRVKALSVMVKAYYRSTPIPFPLYELIDILGFEDETEAVFFCEQVGLMISNDELHIMLNKQHFTHPVASIEQGRAIGIVESKRTKAGLGVGQCIAGGEAPEKSYKNHVPHNSFDSNGYLKSSAINVEDQTKQYKDKSSLARDKNDPYEFMETEISKPPPKLRIQSKVEDQTDFGTKKSDQTFVAEHSTKPFGATNVFNRNPPLRDNSSISNAKAGKSSNVEGNFDSKSKVPNESSAILSRPAKTDPRITVQKPPGINNATPQQTAEVFKLKESSPFATVPNKNIFSGITQGNIFAKAGAGTSIFGNKNFAATSDKKYEKVDFEEKERQRVEAELKKKKLDEERKRIEAEKLKLEELQRRKKLKLIEIEAAQIMEQLQGEITKEICFELVKEEVNKIKMYDTLSRNIADSLLNQVVRQIGEELLKEEIYIQEQLNKIAERIKQRIVRKYYKSWRQNVTKKKRQREALDDTPVWLQTRTVSECAKLLYHPQQELAIANMRRKKFKSDPVSPKENLAPVEVIIYAGIKENLKSSYNEMIPSVFWKVVISWPDLEHQILLWQQKIIMNTYLNAENYTEEPMIKIYKPNPYETVHICIRHFEGLVSERNLVGTDGLLFLAASSENLNAVKRRLTNIILSRSKLMPIPIIIVFLGQDDLVSENIELELDLEILLESGYVSEYTVVFEKEISANRILRLIQSAALWLTTNKSPLVPLEMNYLNQVLSTCLTQELWLRIQGHSNFNQHLASGLDDPALIVKLHNEAVTHLTDIFLDQESLQYTEFPLEFQKFLNKNPDLPYGYEYFDKSWKKEEYRLMLEQVMDSFSLPEWKYQWPIKNLTELHNAMRSYCSESLPETDCDETACEIISRLFFMSDDSQTPSFVQVLLEIINVKINTLNARLKVVYNKNHVKHFCTLPWWFKSNVLLKYTSEKELESENETPVGEPFEKRQRLEEDEMNENFDLDSFYNTNDSLAVFCKETQKQVIDVHGMCKKLDLEMEKQKMKNKALDELLEQALLDDDSGILNINY